MAEHELTQECLLVAHKGDSHVVGTMQQDTGEVIPGGAREAASQKLPGSVRQLADISLTSSVTLLDEPRAAGRLSPAAQQVAHHSSGASLEQVPAKHVMHAEADRQALKCPQDQPTSALRRCVLH